MVIKTEVTDNTPLWWEIQNIPTELIRELRRRNNTNNIGMFMPQPLNSFTYNFENNQKNYKGPMTPWVRIFSNSTGKGINGLVPRSLYLNKNKQEVDYDGFILKGGEGFYDVYGYTPGQNFGAPNTNNAIIGYQANGKPHYIDNIYRSQLNYETNTTIQNNQFPQNNQVSSVLPPPAILSVNVKQSKEYLTYASFKFKCFSLAQLEYITPFFLTPGINLFIEFGWNLFNQKSMLDLNSINECFDIIDKPQTAIDRSILSNGNYGCITGIITKYNFSTQDGFVYECNVETISRQGLYAGLRTDNNAKLEVNTSDSIETKSFMDLKTFIKLYLPSINEVLKQDREVNGPTNSANFYNFILAKQKIDADSKEQKDAKANEETLKKPIPTPTGKIKEILKTLNSSNVLFYKGRSEDRVFTGRIQDIYKKTKSPSTTNEVIKYGNVNSKNEQISFADEQTDFDAKDGSDQAWLQLDFVFEMINLFMCNLKTKQFKVDISDVIINAHPNLISCDQDVLIPNPVAPKINKGIISRPGVSGKGGFLKTKEGQPLLPGTNVGGKSYSEENPFFGENTNKADRVEKPNAEIDEKIKKGNLDYINLKPEESFYLACEAARKTFKTAGKLRDNLDVIINYLYYNINNISGTEHNAAQSGNKIGSAAFPFASDESVLRTGKDEKQTTVIYKAFYYGYLKHIYISKTKLISIAESEETKNYKQFLNAILNVVNEAVDNFWKFEIQEAKDKSGQTILSIIDKNTINYDALREIYTFELAKTNNVIRNINFDVSLSNEQSVNVQFAGPNSGNLTEKLSNELKTNYTATLNLINNTPVLKFNDRLDQYQLKKIAESISGSLDSGLAPGTASGLNEENNDIADLQKYGNKSKSGVLCITVKNMSDSNTLNTVRVNLGGSIGPGLGTNIPSTANVFSQDIYDDEKNPKNYKFLCLPTGMKSKLRQMLDDNDLKNNIAKYSGVADNFTITLTFDGIFALRNLQCFAISNLPKPYVPGNVVFQILEVEHTIERGSWKTTATALVRCIGGSKLDYIIV